MKSTSYYISSVNFDKDRQVTIFRFQHSSKTSYKDFEVHFKDTNELVESWGFKPLVGSLLRAKVELDMDATYQIKKVKSLNVEQLSDGDIELPLQPKLKTYKMLDEYFTETYDPTWSCPNCAGNNYMAMICENPFCINKSINRIIPGLCPQHIQKIPMTIPPPLYTPGNHSYLFTGSIYDFKRWSKIVVASWMARTEYFLQNIKFCYMSDLVDMIKKDELSTADMITKYRMMILIYDSILEGHRQEDFLYQLILKWGDYQVGEMAKVKEVRLIKPLLINIPGYPDSIKMSSMYNLIENKLITVV